MEVRGHLNFDYLLERLARRIQQSRKSDVFVSLPLLIHCDISSSAPALSHELSRLLLEPPDKFPIGDAGSQLLELVRLPECLSTCQR